MKFQFPPKIVRLVDFFVIQVFHGKAKLSDLWQLVQQFSLIYWKKTCGPLGYLLGVSCFDLELGILHKMPIIEC